MAPGSKRITIEQAPQSDFTPPQITKTLQEQTTISKRFPLMPKHTAVLATVNISLALAYNYLRT